VIALCIVLALASFADPLGVPETPRPPPSAAPQHPPLPTPPDRPQKHVHRFVRVKENKWIEPVTRRVNTGKVDRKGQPIYETVVVKPGYWKTIQYEVCACGQRRG